MRKAVISFPVNGVVPEKGRHSRLDARRIGVVISGMTALMLGVAALGGVPRNPVEVKVAPPELDGGPWFNTPDNKPLKLADRKGTVTLVHFWTFGCINCQRNLPVYARWQKQFAKRGLVIIGVHTPETENEKITANVAREIKRIGMTYSVMIDPQGENWRRWQQQYWPTVYLIDKQGYVRSYWVGELNENRAGGEAIMGAKIEALLREPYSRKP